MENLLFYILDVFAEDKYAGNQLAVVRDTGSLTDSEMQCLAKLLFKHIGCRLYEDF